MKPTGLIKFDEPLTPDQLSEFAAAWSGDHQNVISALAKVMAELPGIGKDSQSPQGYAYRGIEQVTKEAQRLFAKHSVVIAPHRIKWYPTRELTVNGKPWTDERCKVTYRIYGPGGAQDFIEVTTVGIGRDNSDKGSNKALTQAYKYALLEALMIADAKDDLEEKHEADAPPVLPEGWASWDEYNTIDAEFAAEVAAAPAEVRRKFAGYVRESGYRNPYTRDQFDDLQGEFLIVSGDGAHREVPTEGVDENGDPILALAAAECSLCGSTRAARVLDAHGKARCKDTKGCMERVEAKAAQAADPETAPF